jgi:hypothetical protein
LPYTDRHTETAIAGEDEGNVRRRRRRRKEEEKEKEEEERKRERRKTTKRTRESVHGSSRR